MRSFFGVVALFGVASAGTVRFDSFTQGQEFTECVHSTHFTTKTLADDVTTIARDANGCCPKNYTAGVQMYTKYAGAQIVCGFKTDGSVAMTSATSNSVKTCTPNKCYVWKQNLPCADGSKQFLNGCCAATTASKDNSFPALCLNYYYKTKGKDNVAGDINRYCLTYHKNYGTAGDAGTVDKTDDQKDGKLDTAKVYTYAACVGGIAAGSGGSAASGGGASGTSANTADGASSFGMMAVAGAALHSFIF